MVSPLPPKRELTSCVSLGTSTHPNECVYTHRDTGAQYMCGRVHSFAVPATETKNLTYIPVEPNNAQYQEPVSSSPQPDSLFAHTDYPMQAVKSSRTSQSSETQAIPEAEGQLSSIQMHCQGTL